MLIYTCEQMRVIEENADVNGLSYVEMMENAGNACAEKIHSTIVGLNSAAKTVAVLCGSGKNGGDGFVIADILSKNGAAVTVTAIRRHMSPKSCMLILRISRCLSPTSSRITMPAFLHV